MLELNREDGGNRKFILVECEDYASSITAERVRRVINGVPGARDAALREGLGGSFTYCTLGAPIDEEAMLTGRHLPSYSALAAYLLHTASGISTGETTWSRRTTTACFTAATLPTTICGTGRILSGWQQRRVLNEEQAKRISAASKPSSRKAIVFAADKYILQRDLTPMGITLLPVALRNEPGRTIEEPDDGAQRLPICRRP